MRSYEERLRNSQRIAFLEELAALLETYPGVSFTYTNRDDGVYVQFDRDGSTLMNLGFSARDMIESAKAYAARLRAANPE